MTRDELLKCLRYLHTIVPSLEHLAAEAGTMSRADYGRQVAEFVEEWGVAPKLSEIRSALVRSLSEEELLELATLPSWTPPGAPPRPRRDVRKPRPAQRARR